MTTLAKIIIVTLVITVIGLVVFQFIDPNIVQQTVTSLASGSSDVFSVTVSGEVVTEGTYLLDEGTTFGDLIAAAGGATSNADYLCINDDIELISSGSYYVAPIYDHSNVCSTAKIVKYNINTCESSDLENISGIGSTISSNLIKYRDEIGEFKRLEDIMEVSGIGSSTFSKMRNFIRLKDA